MNFNRLISCQRRLLLEMWLATFWTYEISTQIIGKKIISIICGLCRRCNVIILITLPDHWLIDISGIQLLFKNPKLYFWLVKLKLIGYLGDINLWRKPRNHGSVILVKGLRSWGGNLFVVITRQVKSWIMVYATRVQSYRIGVRSNTITLDATGNYPLRWE